MKQVEILKQIVEQQELIIRLLKQLVDNRPIQVITVPAPVISPPMMPSPYAPVSPITPLWPPYMPYIGDPPGGIGGTSYNAGRNMNGAKTQE